ncbi:POK9 protein, partial [Cochlearius cochlearius]|nr:POK9 protein [Cochlearius cochlearius]
SGSAGLDLATAQSVTLHTTAVALIPTRVFGPLGGGRSALLLGRSSTTKMGLFVLPGVIDADFCREIQIMAWTPVPPCYIPAGQKIAQLIPFVSATGKGGGDRNGGFGSTGSPLTFWTKAVTWQQPMLICQINDQNFHGLVDTGADITIAR